MWPASPRCWSRAGCAGRRRSSGSSLRRPTSAPRGNDAVYGAGLVNARAAVAGLSGGSPAGGGGGSSAALPEFVRVKKRQRARTVRRRGIRVRVRAARAGRVRVRVMRRGHLIARGSKRVRAGRATTVVARLTARGRRHTRGRARVRVHLPGEHHDRIRRIRIR